MSTLDQMPSSPGEDFYRALCRSAVEDAPDVHVVDFDVRIPWHMLPLSTRALFSAAASRFLSD